MDPLTPGKQRGVRGSEDAPLDDHTEVAVSPAPWDPASEPTGSDAPIAAPAPLGDDGVLAPGTTLGEYRVDRPIGEGGMGTVYAAVHPLIGKRAAVKVLKKELCRDTHQLERFVDEARVVNQIGHPNIVDVFAFGATADGRSYFVMEWLKGETLRARIARSRVDHDELYAIIKPLARALEAAHEQGVIHRDLKPDNVFLVEVRGDVPNVKLLDFGIAKLAHSEHRVERTATGAMVGTPQYIAPEQAKGYAIDHRVDIYALGGILFEMLTGRPPFVADNAMEMVAKHLMEEPPRPSQLARVEPRLDDLVVQMLAKDPVQRPSLDMLCRVLDGLKMQTPLPSVVGTDVGAARLSAPVIGGGHAAVGSAVTHPATASTRRPTRSRLPWILPLAGLALGLAIFAITRLVGSDDEVGAPVVAPTAPDAAAAEPAPPPPPPVKTEATPPAAGEQPPLPVKTERTTPTPTPTKTERTKPSKRKPIKHSPAPTHSDDDDGDLLDPGSVKRGGS